MTIAAFLSAVVCVLVYNATLAYWTRVYLSTPWIIAVTIALLYVFVSLKRPTGRLVIGGVILTAGLILASIGVLGWQEIESNQAAVGIFRFLTEQMRDVQYAKTQMAASIIGGMACTAVGFVLTISSLLPQTERTI